MKNTDLLFKFIDGDSFMYLLDNGYIDSKTLRKYNHITSGLQVYETFTVCYLVGPEQQSLELKKLLKSVDAYVSEDYNFIPQDLVDWYYKMKTEESGMTLERCLEIANNTIKELL